MNNGGLLPFDDIGSVFPLIAGICVTLVLILVAARKLELGSRARTAEATRRAEQRFHQAADAAPFGMMVVSPGHGIEFANAWIASCFGYSCEELRGRPIDTLIPRPFRDRNSILDSGDVDAASSLPALGKREVIGRKKDGSKIALALTMVSIPGGEGDTMLATFTDIGERERRDELRWKDRAFFWQVIDISPTLIFAKDRQGRYTLANQAVADFYGTTVRSLIGKTDADLNRNTDEVQTLRRAELDAMDVAHGRVVAEESITDAFENRRWLQVVRKPTLAQDGTASHILGSATDITSRKQVEQELELQREQLAHISRVTMLSELSGSLAHELNQPLTAILSNAQAALRFLDRPDPNIGEVRDALRDIVDDNKRAVEVIQGLRLLLKKEGKLPYEPLDLNLVLQDVIKLMSSHLPEAGVSQESDLAPFLPKVSGSRVQLQQVFLNLLINACEAMADCAPANRRLVVSTAYFDDGLVQVRVADQGPGIEPKLLERVFEPYFTTKENGLGLGLAVCHQIVTAHNGSITAMKNAWLGTTFCISLPALRGVDQ